jgi:hypothetical protein
LTRNRKPTRGGRRDNAGRPATTVKISKRFRLSVFEIAVAEALGNGNQTEGVRKALSFAHDNQDQLETWERQKEHE